MSRQIASASRTDWQTPPEMFLALALAIGGFKVDAAADKSNSLCMAHYGPGSLLGNDALAIPEWLSPAWVNPPYVKGEQWRAWMAHMVKQGVEGRRVVALIPAATGTKWWREFVVPYADIMFLTGRVNFVLPRRRKRSQGNHDSAIVMYGPDSSGAVGWIDAKPDKWHAAIAQQENESKGADTDAVVVEAAELRGMPAGDTGDGVHGAVTSGESA